MKKVVRSLCMIGCLALAIGIVWLCNTYLGSGNWPVRFHAELDEFFGEGNWECVSEEQKESLMYSVTYRDVITEAYTEKSGTYKNWYIAWTTPAGETEIWQITNHTLKINHDKYGFFSGKRYSNKQAFVLELMEIAQSVAAEEVHRDILEELLTQEEADCIDISVSYYGGNPEPEFYDRLWKEDWFGADDITADNFLSTELYDFYLWIHVYDYRFEKLSEEEQQHVLDSFETIQQALLEAYGEHASFELYLGDGYRVKYIDGIRQDS